MKKLLLTVLMLVLPLASFKAYAAQEEGIAVVVNDDAVTFSDINDRMKLIMASSGLSDTKEMRERLGPQVTGMIVDEVIKLQEAERIGVEVTEEEMDRGFSSVAGQNNLTPEQFSEMLRKKGVSARSLKDQIRAQIAWSHVVQNKLRPSIFVTEKDVEDRLTRLQASKGKTEYLVAEIFLPVDKSSPDKEARNLAEKLVNEIRGQGAPFSAVAQQFSKSAGASQGGDMGWIQADQLPKDTGPSIVAIKEGTISDPVRSPSGYHIFLMRKKREITDDTIPPREYLLNQIGMERLDRLQQRHLLDLKADAFIENRV